MSSRTWSNVAILSVICAMMLVSALLLSSYDFGRYSTVMPTYTISETSPSPIVASPTLTTPVSTSVPPIISVPPLPAGCEVAKGLTQPVSLEIDPLGARSVVALPPEDGLSPAPPDFNPDVFAWNNRSGELGADKYKALFTAHTYSSRDTALGNQLLKHLGEGNVIRAIDSKGSTLCYEVAHKLQVAAEQYREVVASYSETGLLMITVCSGLKDGEWTTRTIWVAQLMGE